jgi:hypothetical protein
MCIATKGCQCAPGWTGIFCAQPVGLNSASPSPKHKSSSSNGGAIAGGVVGGLAVVGVAAAVWYYRCVW